MADNGRMRKTVLLLLIALAGVLAAQVTDWRQVPLECGTPVQCADNSGLPEPIVITFPLEDVEDLRAYEGRLVTFPQELQITEFYDFDRFGEIVLAWVPPDLDRWFQPTVLYGAADPQISDYLDLMERSRIVLDDGSNQQNPADVRHPDGSEFTAEHRFRGGDTVSHLTGVLEYAHGSYRIQPVFGSAYTPANARTEQPDPVGGTVRAAVFNVLNYFTTLGSRGADSIMEFNRQRDKIISAIATIDAHVVGLIEIENNHDQSSLQDLVAGLNAAVGDGGYDYIRTVGRTGTDQITNAFIYQPDVLQPVGAAAVLAAPEFVNPFGSNLDRNRPAVAQTFMETASGEVFTVVINHFKSKGSACGEHAEGGLTGSCDLTRTVAARELLDWLQTDPTDSGNAAVLLLGDFNAYVQEEPIYVLKAGFDGISDSTDDFTDLLSHYQGAQAYTYVFDGQWGSLVYAFASPALKELVTGTTAWNINSDEPDILDYGLEFKPPEQAELYRPDPFRASDHDPIIIGLELQN